MKVKELSELSMKNEMKFSGIFHIFFLLLSNYKLQFDVIEINSRRSENLVYSIDFNLSIFHPVA